RLEMRLAAAALAIRLYRIDQGAWPASLDALVPKYLSEVPRDPFSSSGTPLGYLLIKGGLPDGADRPVVYALAGRNDISVDETMPPLVPTFCWDMRTIQFRDVTMWSPAAATQPADSGSSSSQQTVDDRPGEANQPRQNEK